VGRRRSNHQLKDFKSHLQADSPYYSPRVFARHLSLRISQLRLCFSQTREDCFGDPRIVRRVHLNIFRDQPNRLQDVYVRAS